MYLKSRISKKNQGISLLEVLAALVILSLGATVTLTWFSQSMTTMNRMAAQEKVLLAQMEVIEFLRSVNPADKDEGQTTIRDYLVEWQSVAKGPMQKMMGNRGGTGMYEVGLFDVSIKILSEDGKEMLSEFKVELAGYKKIPDVGKGIW